MQTWTRLDRVKIYMATSCTMVMSSVVSILCNSVLFTLPVRDSDFESWLGFRIKWVKNRMLIDFTNFFQTQWPKLSQLHQTAWADIHVTSAARFSSIRAHFSTIDTSTAGHTDARHVERPSVGDGIWRDIWTRVNTDAPPIDSVLDPPEVIGEFMEH